MTRDELNEQLSAKAWELGKKYGKENRFKDVEKRCKDYQWAYRTLNHPPGACDVMAREAQQMGSPDQFFDVFKYGAQSAWRRLGELSDMIAHDLEPGDVFKIDPPDPESPVRVCLTNDRENGLRFGWPSSKVRFEAGLPKHDGYWCYMGNMVPVWLVRKEGA